MHRICVGLLPSVTRQADLDAHFQGHFKAVDSICQGDIPMCLVSLKSPALLIPQSLSDHPKLFVYDISKVILAI